MKFEIKPHIGTNNINFGMPRREVQMILGKPEFSKEKTVFEYQDIMIPEPAKDGYFENELQISYNDSENVEFIEFSGKCAQHTRVFLNGIDIFETPAQQLLIEIAKITNTKFDETDDEIPYSYVYRDFDLALWRQVIPEIDENYEEVPENDEGKYFWTIGIGIKGYYKKE